MNSKIYLDLSEKTLSDIYEPDLVDLNEFKFLIKQFVELCYQLDNIKSKLFYGKDKTKNIPESFYENLDKLDLDDVDDRLLHAILGISTESGELFEALLDDENRVDLLAESGDVEWFLQIIYRHFETNSDIVRNTNIQKLFKRYGDKFTQDAAIIRDLDSEYKVLENC
jgi:NTP pyrophosphatase (non-canonical NTP hydrolase)